MTPEAKRYQRLVKAVDREAARSPDTDHIHPDAKIIKVLLWASLHDRPIVWACQAAHWPRRVRLRPLPSQSCLSRRLSTRGVLALLERIHTRLRQRLPAGLLKFIDAKALPVGGCSKDRDALYGRAAGGKAKGYKLFTLVDAVSGAVEAWRLGPMNQPEEKVAAHLLAQVPGPALIVGDGVYDINRLYAQAGKQDLAWLARPPEGAGAGRRRQSPERLVGLEVGRSQTGVALLTARVGIERAFGHLTSFGGGLGPLPAWVRRPHRVVVWVAAKWIINLDRQRQLWAQQNASCAA